jgi:hypothetical protein
MDLMKFTAAIESQVVTRAASILGAIYAAFQPYPGPIVRTAKLEVSAEVWLPGHEAWMRIFDMLHSDERCPLHLQLLLTSRIML